MRRILLAVIATAALTACDSNDDPAEPSNPGGKTDDANCDPLQVCGQALTCVDGQEYPTTCGPSNCDDPIGPCGGDVTSGTSTTGATSTTGPACDPLLVCGQALTCIDGLEYPTTCGPTNCDEPLGPCGDGSTGGWETDGGGTSGQGCDPTLVCGQALTCVDGLEYPTTCGPGNCDEPLGPCSDDSGGQDCDPLLVCGQALTCVDGLEYPTTCGPANCDQPLGPC